MAKKTLLTDKDIVWHPDWDAIVAHEDEQDYLLYTSVGYPTFLDAMKRFNGFIAQLRRQGAPLVPFNLHVEITRVGWNIEIKFDVLELIA